MTKNIRIPVVAFLLLCCNLISYAQETEHAKLDRYLRLLRDKNKFMGSVSVFSKGTEIYARSVGFADIDKQIVADAQSEYHIGSILETLYDRDDISSHRSRTAFLILTDRFVFSYH